jgi:hypothetical protein
MVKKTLLLFVLLFTLYTLLVLKFPKMGITQNQNQENAVKAEKYLYENSEHATVAVVGTSLSARLVMDSLSDFTSLAFSGMSLSEGLSIIIRKPQLPKIVFLETNFYWYNASPEFQNTVLNPVNFYLKEYIPSFRSDRQPLALATHELIRFLKGLRQSEESALEDDPQIFQADVFENTLEDYKTIPDSNAVAARAEELKQQIEWLEKEGVKIIFFEMPIHSQLIHTVKYQYLKGKLRSFFPESKYSYVPCQPWEVTTTDGIHLTYRESLQFTLYIRDYYKTMLGTNQPANVITSRIP